jgi:hypothetical protein
MSPRCPTAPDPRRSVRPIAGRRPVARELTRAIIAWLALGACAHTPNESLPRGSSGDSPNLPAKTGMPKLEDTSCSPERGRTSAEIRQAATRDDALTRSERAGLVVVVREGYLRERGTVARPIDGAIVEYWPAAQPGNRSPARLPRHAAGNYRSDSLLPGRYAVQARAIGHRTMAYDLSLVTGRRDTLLIELAAASLCPGGT